MEEVFLSGIQNPFQGKKSHLESSLLILYIAVHYVFPLLFIYHFL